MNTIFIMLLEEKLIRRYDRGNTERLSEDQSYAWSTMQTEKRRNKVLHEEKTDRKIWSRKHGEKIRTTRDRRCKQRRYYTERKQNVIDDANIEGIRRRENRSKTRKEDQS